MSLPFAIPSLTSERLILRAPREQDFDAMLAFNASPRAGFIGGEAPRQQVWRGLLANIGHWALRGYGFFSVDTHAGEFVGRVGVINHDGWPEPELAWHLFDGAEDKGYAIEAALAARADAHTRLGMPALMSMIDPANRRSLNLARRLGAAFERSGSLNSHAYHLYRHPAPETIA